MTQRPTTQAVEATAIPRDGEDITCDCPNYWLTLVAVPRQVHWAVDIIGASSALLLALLARAEQRVRYASGRVISAMSAAFTGGSRTDAKDAYGVDQAEVGSTPALARPMYDWEASNERKRDVEEHLSGV